MNLDKLKEAARKFEQREEWRRAIDVYLQAIREAEEAGGEGTQDPALYNRVGFVDITALTDKVAEDIEIARNWKTGTLKDDGNRSNSEKGFRK